MTVENEIDPAPAEQVGERIRQALYVLMARQRVSAAELSRRMGWGSPDKLYARLKTDPGRKKTRLSIEEAARLAELLGSSFYELVELSRDDRIMHIRWNCEPLELAYSDGQEPLPGITFGRRATDGPHLSLV